jgi:hypothetical protein
MAPERCLENNGVRNRGPLGDGDSVVICRSRLGREVDVAILPIHGSPRLVLVEAKQGTAADATSKVVGQLLMYDAGALRLGTRGWRLIHCCARECAGLARSAPPKSLTMWSGGMRPPETAWRELHKGRKLRPEQMALCVALDGGPPTALPSTLEALAQHHKLDSRVVSVLGRNRLQVWRAV